MLHANRAFVASAAVTLTLACGYKTPGQRARDHARSLTPDQVRAAQTTRGTATPTETHIISVRVWADQDYRRRPAWRKHVRQMFERATDIVQPLGLRFDPVVREWQRTSDGAHLEELLIELESLDAGENADWVVGLSTAISALEASTQHLGMARPLSRHFVVRDMTDLAEHDAIREGLHLLPEEEQRALYSKRLAHKEIVVLLHEWGHVLGALHMRDRQWIMNPAYDHEATGFSPLNQGILEIGIRHHLAAAEEMSLTRWQEEIAAYVRAHPEARVDPEDRERILAGKFIAPVDESVRLSSRELKIFNRAVDQINASDAEGAWTQIEMLMSKHRDNGRVMNLACHIAAKRQPESARDLCKVAAMVDTKSPRPLLTSAHMALKASDAAQALTHMKEADQRLRAQPDPEASSCLDLAGLWLAANELSATERNLECASAGQTRDDIASAALGTRRQWGLAPDVELGEPGAEHEYIAAMLAAYETLRRSPNAAAKEASSLVAKFPDATGPLALLCAARLSQRRLDEADTLCRRALKRYDQTVLARYMLAHVSLSRGKTEAATAHLEEVVTLSPLHKQAWTELGDLYRRQANTTALADLERRYRAQFGNALPSR